jgi:ABC-type polysaccharide/polyol phosphate transport system ATPase subunit
LHAAGHTIVLVSHDPRQMGSFCSRAAMLEQGRIAAAGPAGEIAAAYVWRLTTKS